MTLSTEQVLATRSDLVKASGTGQMSAFEYTRAILYFRS